jgi:hypothetical protein
MTPHPDRFGYYRVGDLKFYSKLEAIEMHTRTGVQPHWDFNEAVFSSYDWTIEPKESILELYRQRAQQLRDQYDYIVLVYSGGADSETILQSFIDNDILLDEVASYVNYAGTGSKTSFMNEEIFGNAIPRLARLKEQYPWLKHRVIEMADLQLEHFKKQEVKFDWIYSVNSCFDSNCVAREELPLNIKDWANIINQGKKLCLLWGYDKPRVFHENGRFSMKFIDIIDSGPTVKSFKGQLPYSDEPFYWTPDLPNIVIKQGHLIKNYLNNHLTNLPHFSTTDKSDLAYRTVNGRKFWLSKDAVHSIIYPGYQLGTLTAAKPTSIIMSERDTWFYNIENSNKSLQVWRMGIDKLWKTLPDYWKNDPNNMLKGVKHCWSKEYYLE